MKVVFLKNVVNIGKAGQVKQVADGFARNFLIPQGLAQPATKLSMLQLEKRAEVETLQTQQELVRAQQLATELDGAEFIIHQKAQQGRLFGAVSSAVIAEVILQKGIAVQDKQIHITEPIKQVGEHSVRILLDHGIEAEVKLIVEAAQPQ